MALTIDVDAALKIVGTAIANMVISVDAVGQLVPPVTPNTTYLVPGETRIYPVTYDNRVWSIEHGETRVYKVGYDSRILEVPYETRKQTMEVY